MKILYVVATLSLEDGGPTKACLEMSAAMAKRGHRVRVFTTNADGPRDTWVPNERVPAPLGVDIRCFQVQFPRSWRASFPMAEALRAEVRDYDLVVINSLYLFHNWVAGKACREQGVPYIIRPHGTLDPVIRARKRVRKWLLERLYEEANLSAAAGVHYTSEDERRLAEPFAYGSQGFVVPLGIRSAECSADPPPGLLRKRFPELKDKRILLFLSRINFKKGLDLLVPAFADALTGYSDAHLVLAGPDNEGYGQEVRRLIRQHAIESRVTLTGHLEGDLKASAFREAEAFVLPSYGENFGISVIEAAASGVPVLISDRVNIHDGVTAARAGLVVPCDKGRIAEAMREFLRHPEWKAEMGANGKRWVRENFDWDKVGERLEAEYVKRLRPR